MFKQYLSSALLSLSLVEGNIDINHGANPFTLHQTAVYHVFRMASVRALKP